MMQLISQNTTVVTFKKGITQVKRYDYSTFVEEFDLLQNALWTTNLWWETVLIIYLE